MVLAEWTAHPAKRRPEQVALVVAVTLVFCAGILALLQSGFLAVLAAVLLVFSVAPFLFPTRYRLTDEAVEERRAGVTRRRRWEDLRRAHVGRAAALVSPFSRPHWLDRYRGVTLMFDGADRDRVVAILQEKLP